MLFWLPFIFLNVFTRSADATISTLEVDLFKKMVP